MTTPSSLLILALSALVSLPAAAQPNGKPPIKGPGCGVPPVGVPLSQGAVLAAVRAAAGNLERVETTPVEFAAVTTLLSYGAEGVSASGHDEAGIRAALTGKRDYWRAVAGILEKASTAAQDDKSRAGDPDLVKHSTTLSRQHRLAEKLAADAEKDLAVLDGEKAKRPESAQAILDRKAALFRHLAEQKF